MKTKLILLGSIMTFFLASFGARAELLVQDNFPYSAGPIGPASGGNGTGGGGNWVSGAGSLYGTTGDIVASGFNSLEIMGTGNSDLPRTYFTNGVLGLSIPLAPLFTNTVYYFPSNAPAAALYASFTINVDSSAFSTNQFGNSGSSYFAYFTDTNFNFSPRIFVVTNGAAPGNYRVQIIDGTGVVPTDLAPGSPYTVVARFVLSTGQSTLWVNPVNETSTGYTSSTLAFINGISTPDAGGVITTNNTSTCGFGVRNFSHGGPIFISSLAVGTSFADVVPSSDGSNPLFIQTQPQNATNFAGQPAALSVVAGGDQDTIAYQWSIGGQAIPGATSNSYAVASLVASNQGTYTVTITNAATPGGVTSSNATLTVLPSDIPPTISGQPTNSSFSAGSSAIFTVTAGAGGAPLTYQWYLGATALASQTSSALTISTLQFSNAGTYKVIVTNPNGDSVTSSNAVLTVTPPAPIIANIQYIRSLLDNTNYNTNALFFTNGGPKLFKITGTNTTWQNLTTSGNSEFYIQDATAGIVVFWSGAASASHMPPAGAVVTVVGPASVFSGLLEISPVFTNTFHSVTWSNVGPLPVPMALPFDPIIYTNANLMQKHLVGEYFAATNVFLDQDSGPVFASNANEPMTNGVPGTNVIALQTFNATTNNPLTGTNILVHATNVNGQVFNVIFYNNHTDIVGSAKPTGPVTIYGALGIFSSSQPFTSGYELTPSRYADIVPAVTITNVISNVVRYGDLATNSFNSTVLQPGETVTMTVYARDPGAGTATLSGLTNSSTNGAWSAITGNGTSLATATYTYTATVGAEGTADIPTLTASFSSSGFTGNYTNLNVIYVPTPAEQNIRITEVFASPTSNTNAAAFDPLLRPLPETVPVANDQYIEIVNFNTNALNINRWAVFSGLSQVFNFVNGETPGGGMSTVLYGGPSGSDSNAPTLFTSGMAYRENIVNGFSFSANGGTVSLYNLPGYLIDRVAYPASGFSITNSPTFNLVGQTPGFPPVGSFSRFPTMNSPLVPQAFISTNYVTPGLQYDGGPWTNTTSVPAVTVPVTVANVSNTTTLTFTANTTNTSTLWLGNSLAQPFSVLAGGVFTNGSGSFVISNTPPPFQYYIITTP
jgi:hypothetical protein